MVVANAAKHNAERVARDMPFYGSLKCVAEIATCFNCRQMGISCRKRPSVSLVHIGSR